jgi:hypothetical protein
LLSLLILITLMHVAPGYSGWTMAGADAQHTGEVGGADFSTELNTNYQFADDTTFAPAIFLPNGDAVVGSTKGTLYCLRARNVIGRLLHSEVCLGVSFP